MGGLSQDDITEEKILKGDSPAYTGALEGIHQRDGIAMLVPNLAVDFDVYVDEVYEVRTVRR